MGLIKAGIGALGGTLADQWKEYFYCDALAADVLAAKGRKRTSSRSSNTKAEDNIISNGAVIAVNEGQCMMIVEQGGIFRRGRRIPLGFLHRAKRFCGQFGQQYFGNLQDAGTPFCLRW